MFTVTASPVSPDFQTMKRNVLCKAAWIFDLLGFLSRKVIVAKILLQELWIRGHDWDDELQDDIKKSRGLFRAVEKSETGEDSSMSTKSRACQVEAH